MDKPPAPQKQEQPAPTPEPPEAGVNRAPSAIKPAETSSTENLASILSLKPPVIVGDNSLPNLADYLPQILAKKAPGEMIDPVEPEEPNASVITPVAVDAPPPAADQTAPAITVQGVKAQEQAMPEASKLSESTPPQIVPLTTVELSELCQSTNRLFNMSLLNTDPIVKDDLSLGADRENRRSAIAGLLLPSSHIIPTNSLPNSTENRDMIEVAIIAEGSRPQRAVLLPKSDQPMNQLNELLSFLEAQGQASSRKLAE